jgi:hypothetical protein
VEVERGGVATLERSLASLFTGQGQRNLVRLVHYLSNWYYEMPLTSLSSPQLALG